MIYPSGNVINYNLHKKLLKLLPLLLKSLQHIQSKTNKKKLYLGSSTRRNYLESFDYGFIYNRVGFFNASSQLFPNNTLSSFTIILPEQVNLDGQWDVAFSEISYLSIYQNVTEGKFMFYDEKLCKTTKAYYLKPGLYSSITDILEAVNTLIRKKQPERHLHHNQS